ncbi:MAG TPA: S-layer homology domain-containing protein [Anaerovoracaceae bacterium]|nr:S-layer homology domain-containing protein [Anaerovoracaceae bacterium]
MNKMIALIISCMIVITGADAVYGAEYADVATSNWAHEAVNAMSNQSIIVGYPDGSFRPDSTVTYGEFIKMALIAATGEDVGNSPTDHWALNYYNKALELGHFTEYDIDRSYLGSKIPRAHMALIISSILGDVKIDGYDEIQEGITDITYQTKYEYDITKAYATGILTGYTDKTFQPDKTLSRAEAATVIYRLVDESKRVLPGDGKEEGRTVTATTSRGTVFETTLKTGQLGDSYGIVRFEIVQYGYVRICSTVRYDAVDLVIDNKLVTGFGNPSGGNYWIEDGYYVYYSEPEKDGIDVKGKKLAIYGTMLKGEDTGIIEYPDVTL